MVLPEWRRKAKGIETEGEYNTRVGTDVPGLVTMDKAFVRGRADRPWSLEVCDLLAEDGTLIHVSRQPGPTC